MGSTIHVDAIHIWAASALSLSKQEWHNHFLTAIKTLQVQTDTGRLWNYVRDDHPFGGTAPLAVWFRYS
jgi:hypothetical protein